MGNKLLHMKQWPVFGAIHLGFAGIGWAIGAPDLLVYAALFVSATYWAEGLLS